MAEASLAENLLLRQQQDLDAYYRTAIAAAAGAICAMALIICCMSRHIRQLRAGAAASSTKPIALVPACTVRRGSLESLVANPASGQSVLTATEATEVAVATATADGALQENASELESLKQAQEGGAGADPEVADAV